MLAFSVWNALWVVFVAFLLVNVVMLFGSVIADLVRDRDLSGGKKAMWAFTLLLFPVLGVLAYLIVRGGSMTERAILAQQEAKASMDWYIRDAAAGPAAELERAANLRSLGAIDDDEYSRLKAKILG